MNNNQLIKYKESVFSKIKNLFKNLFIKKQVVIPVQNELIETSKINHKNNKNNYEDNKKNFMDLYEKTKKGDIDLFSIDPEKLEKMCKLLEEEIKIKERNLQEKKNRLSA